MIAQKDREFFYFKLPVFFMDFGIHFSVVYAMLRTLPESYLTGLPSHLAFSNLFLFLFLSLVLALNLYGLKLHERRIKPMYVFYRAIIQTVITYIIFSAFISIVFKATPRFFVIQSCAVSSLLIGIWHLIANMMVRVLRKLGRNTRQVVIIGADENAKRLYRELSYGQVMTGYVVAGFFSSLGEIDLPEGAKYLGYVADFPKWIKENNVDELYCSLPPAQCSKEVNQIIRICNDKFIDFYYVPVMDGYPHRQMTFEAFGRVNIIKLRDEPLNTIYAKVLKRSFDFVASSLFLITLYPFVFLFVWIGDLVSGSKGPVYFRQARTGYNGRSFMIYKFRSMKVNDQADTLQATEDDPRKTKFGDFLRRSSIDELPQMINVFKGDMSLIGPRPHMEHHTEVYSELISDYMVRHLAKPGITGWAQVNGCRGETKTVEEMKDRVDHDIWYIEHWSPLLDIEIFFKTLWQVLPGHDKQAY